MTIARTVVGLGLIGAILLGGTATAMAATGRAAAPHNTPLVTAWHDVNARFGCAATTCPIDEVSNLKAGETVPAFCWTYGEKITAYGITNDVWVEISLEDGAPRYVSAVFLKGNKYANLPFDYQCGKVS